MIQVRVFLGVGETMAEATEEAEDKANDWIARNQARIDDGVPIQLHAAATVSVVNLAEGVTETCTHSITLLYGERSLPENGGSHDNLGRY